MDYFKATASIVFEKFDRRFCFCFWAVLNTNVFKFTQATIQICQNSFS